VNVERLVLGELSTNCFIVSDGAEGPLVVIDPAGDEAELLAAVAGRPVVAIVLTHGHFDHLGAARALVDATGAPLLVHVQDAASITTPEGTGGALWGFRVTAPEADRTLREGDVVEAGVLRLEVLHTPGHTPGSISLFVAGSGDVLPHLFCGDTVFAGSVGRTDFRGGDPRAMRESVTRIAGLPLETRIHSGHGPDTTVAREYDRNPFFPRA
jgi:hydroxyacylglutathione hydrolase